MIGGKTGSGAPAGRSVWVVIPAYQAAATIAGVIAGIRAHVLGATICAVDDGSTDGTQSAAATADVVLRHETNRGKGAALRTAYAAALATGAGVIVALDADGQHDPARIPELLGALRHADVVIGVRQRSAKMPWLRRLANGITSSAMSQRAGVRLSDGQSGFRAFRAEVLNDVNPGDDRYEYEIAFLIRAARAGFRVAEVSIPTIYGSETSHFRLFRDTARVARVLWRPPTRRRR